MSVWKGRPRQTEEQTMATKRRNMTNIPEKQRIMRYNADENREYYKNMTEKVEKVMNERL